MTLKEQVSHITVTSIMVYRINATENSLHAFIQDRYENDTYQLSNFKDVTAFPIQTDRH